MTSSFFRNGCARLQAPSFPLKMLVALVAGAVMVPAMPPYGLWPLLLVGFTTFYVLLSTLSGWRAFAAGWAFGFGYFACGLYWIANALMVPGNDYAWVYPFAIAGLPAVLAIFTAVAAVLARRFAPAGTFAGFLIFCVAFGGMEWLRGHLFTGYPWNLYGYTWAALLPVAQLASLGGAYFLTLVTIIWAALPGYALLAAPRHAARALIVGVLSFGLVIAFGFIRMDMHPTILRHDILVRAVQPNIAQEDKWNPRKAYENFDRHLVLSEPKAENRDKTTILIWPETAVPFYMMNDPSARVMLRTVMEGYEMPVYLVTGLLRRDSMAGAADDDAKFYNSLVVLNSEAENLAIYDKAHLVPFGEYIPFQKFMPFGPFVQFSGFVAGDGPRTLSVQALPPFSPLICYEVIFPGAATDRTSADRPQWLVNITNDAWYGDSMGPRQHFIMTVFRAIEQGVPVVRAANTGISGVVDPVGRVIHKASLFTENDANVPLPAPLDRPTLFSRYTDILFFLTLATMLTGGLALHIRKRL
ncbi:MAG: apolipoprotein N-acyltransferase [Alphaproteobacteria bacterium]|nr:apolipoprotein N-acyltransferase [Alphaproteobacteria bacterium]MBU0858422.1 apolipoprotein N-acyltransferase [Alphaproteobacteria bacterium]